MGDYLTVLVISITLGLADAQCFTGGDIAASVLVPLILTSLIVAAVVIALWKTRKIVFCPGSKPLKPVEGNGSAAHRTGDHAEAYSNQGFTDDTEIPGEVAMEEGHGGFTEGSDRSRNGKDKKTPSPKKGTQKGSPTSQQTSPNKRTFDLPVKNLNRMVSTTSLDDTFLNTNPEIVSVNLQSQDFIGLGFNIQGSMRDGIRVSQVHNRGPAIESGKIHAGDKIQSVTISFDKMVYEDALTILSYASPYPVKITLQQNGRLVPDRRSASDLDLQLNHPIYRSQSLDALNSVGKDPTFKTKRNFSEMKSSDSNRNGHAKIHSVQLSSCKEGENKNSGDLAKWRDVNLPDFQDGKFTDEADRLFSDADRLFVDAKRNVDRKTDVDVQVKNQNVEVTPGEISFNSTADKTNTSFFNVTSGDTSGDTSMLSNSTFPSDTLDDITVSLNDTPVNENVKKVQDLEVEGTKTATDFDALFSKMGDSKASVGIDHTFNVTGDVPTNEDKGASLFDVQLEMDQAESRVSKGLSEGFLDAKQSVETEAAVNFDSFNKKRLDVEDDIVPEFQSTKLNAALDLEKQTSVEEDEIVPESHRKGFDVDSQIEFEDVERPSGQDKGNLSEVAEKLTHHMLRESSSVEASVKNKDLPSDDDPVVEENLEAVKVRRDSDNDHMFGASLRDTRPLFQDEVVVDDVMADSVTQQFSVPNVSIVRKVNSNSADEESSADEGEYKIQSPNDQADIEISHDLSAEDLKSFKYIMSDRASKMEASSGDVIQELRRGVYNEDVDISTRPITRALSYDVVLGSRDNDAVHPIEGRTGSFKSEKKGQVDSSFLEWSGKRLVRSGSFGEIPQLEDKGSEDQDWTFNNNIDEDNIDEAFEKYKNFQVQQEADSDSEERSSQLIKTKIYPGKINLADLSGNNSGASSRSASPVTANGGTHTSSETHFVSKSYTISSDSSLPEGSGSLGLGKYSFSVRTGSDGEESDSMA